MHQLVKIMNCHSILRMGSRSWTPVGVSMCRSYDARCESSVPRQSRYSPVFIMRKVGYLGLKQLAHPSYGTELVPNLERHLPKAKSK